MPFDFDLLCLLSCRRSLWYRTASGCNDTGFLTLALVGCDGRCVWYPYSAVMSLGLGGYLWLGVGRCCCSTSEKCLECLWLYGILLVWSVKWMVYLSRTGFPSLDDYGWFSAVVWLRSFLDLANLFWLKVLLVPVGVWSLGWSVGAFRLWGWFEILYSYVNGVYVSNFAICDGIFTLLYFVQMGAWVV